HSAPSEIESRMTHKTQRNRSHVLTTSFSKTKTQLCSNKIMYMQTILLSTIFLSFLSSSLLSFLSFFLFSLLHFLLPLSPALPLLPLSISLSFFLISFLIYQNTNKIVTIYKLLKEREKERKRERERERDRKHAYRYLKMSLKKK